MLLVSLPVSIFVNLCFLLFILRHIYNVHTNKMRANKTKIHITVISSKATITLEIKVKEKQLQNSWIINGVNFSFFFSFC